MVTDSRMELNVDGVREELGGVGRWLCEAAAEGTTAHEVERTLFRKILELGKRLFGGFLEMVGDGDLGEQVTLPDEHVVQRLKNAHERRLRTVFGEFTLSRRVYGTEERKAIELIATEDNKGIPMVRPVEAPPPGAHLTKGQKKNKKKMACVGCVSSVDQHVRTPEELVKTLFRDPDRLPTTPPKAQHKRYWASLTREIAGEEVCGQTEVFQHLRDDIALRRKPRQELINLCDGQRSLETDRDEYLPRDEHTIDILDLMHVLPRLWEAAHLFHAEASDAATSFVRQRLLRVLQGQAKSVIAYFRRQGTIHQLRGAKRKKLDRLTDFLETNLHRMRYDEYLAAGYPIATGVIEGACRHVVKDRMERSGMRWKIPGAQAMLALRTIHTNGDWEDFQEFRVRHETQRLYPHAQKFQAIAWPLKSISV